MDSLELDIERVHNRISKLQPRCLMSRAELDLLQLRVDSVRNGIRELLRWSDQVREFLAAVKRGQGGGEGGDDS